RTRRAPKWPKRFSKSDEVTRPAIRVTMRGAATTTVAAPRIRSGVRHAHRPCLGRRARPARTEERAHETHARRAVETRPGEHSVPRPEVDYTEHPAEEGGRRPV